MENLKTWMNLYGSDVLNVAYSYVHNYHQAQDLTQEVFLRAFAKMDSFRGESSVRTWLLSITANRCKDFLRSWVNKHEQIDETCLNTQYATSNTEEEVSKKMEQDALWQAVFKLPLKYREVVVLYYQRELSGHEIAEVLNVREETIRTRLYRARTMLKEILEKAGGWNGANGF